MPKKKNTKINLPPTYLDLSQAKPPTRPAIDSMLENLHNAVRTISP